MALSGASRILLVTALMGGGVAALPPTVAQGAVGTVEATLVKTTWTGGPNSNWVHPSPDPSGVTYNSATGKLIIGDGEVEETNLSWHVYKGTNLFVASLGGELLETGANTLAYSNEPTGVGFRPQLSSSLPERLFVSDDDQARIFEVNKGGDGRYGTSDDTQTSSSVAFLHTGSRNDAEDVAVDLEQTSDGRLLLVDGKGKRVFLYNPGPDRVFNDDGDFVEAVINVGNMGAGDPEGIAYNKFRKTMFVVDDPSNTIYEVALDGTLLNRITLPFKMKSGAGIALAPPSSGSGAWNAYIVDRGVDNDTNGDTFNDGRLFEVAIPGLTGDDAPTVSPPPPSGGTTLDIPVRVGSDDAEERTKSGKVVLGSGDLNLAQEDAYPQVVGVRFTDVTIPAGATITKAYVQFQTDEVKTGTSNLTIVAEVGDAPATFTTASKSISARLGRATAASVPWSPPAWQTVGARTTDQRTADLSAVLQELVSNSANWDSGDPVVLLVTGTGERTAESYNGGARKAPVLHVEYTL